MANATLIKMRMLSAAWFGFTGAFGILLIAAIFAGTLEPKGINSLLYGVGFPLFVPAAAISGVIFGPRVVASRNFLLAFLYGIALTIMTSVVAVLIYGVFLEWPGFLRAIKLGFMFIKFDFHLYGIPYLLGGGSAMLYCSLYRRLVSSKALESETDE